VTRRWTKGKRLALVALVEIVAIAVAMVLAVGVIPSVAPPPSVPTATVPGDVRHDCPRTLRPCR